MAPSFPTVSYLNDKPRDIPSLDGLRAIAVLMVLLTHFKEATPHWMWQVLNQGGFGIYLFFVLSGFLITRILLTDKKTPHFFRNFYARRTLRIFPLYYGILALHFWVLLTIMPTTKTLEDAHYQGWLWAYGYNILMAIKGRYFFSSDWMGLGHFWTLAVEEQFYLVWPFIVLTLNRENLLRLCIWIVALTPALRLLFYAFGANHYWIAVFTPCQLDSLALGAIIACLEASGGLAIMAPNARRIALGLGAILVTCSFFYPRSPETNVAFIFYHGAVALFFGAIVGLAACGSFAWLGNRVFREVGQKSYGMYVFHVPLLVIAVNYAHLPTRLRHWAWRDGLGDILFFVLMILATYSVAFVSYNVYEKQFLKLKRFFRNSIKETPGMVSHRAVVLAEPAYGGVTEIAKDETESS